MKIARRDFEFIRQNAETVKPNFFEPIRNARIFLTGGTGFFGSWLVETFVWLNRTLDLNAQLVVLSRDPDAFIKQRPGLEQESSVSFHVGDIVAFEFPSEKFDFIIHAA